MRLRLWILGMLFLPLFLAAPAVAQEHIADPAAMHRALAGAQATDNENRAVVLKALEREDVRQMADRFGVDVQTAASAVRGMSGAELAELAVPAHAIAADQTGGATTVVISLTTLILILIIVILLVN